MKGYTNHAFALQDSVLLQDMCGDAWIQKSSLTSWRGLGEGAFATVQHCTLKQENGQAVRPLTCWPCSCVRDCACNFVMQAGGGGGWGYTTETSSVLALY